MKSFRLVTFSLVGLTVVLASCFNSGKKPMPLARVYNSYLYPSDIANLIVGNVSKEDSALIVDAYIDKWIQTQLMLKIAENNLSDSQKNVTRQLEDYRTSLLIFKYEQAYLNQKLDTVIKMADLKAYYDDNKDNFVLNETIVKALYIKLRREAPQIKKIRELYLSNSDEDIKQLDNIAYQAATKYDYFNDKWIPLSFILRELPFPIANPQREVFEKRYVEMEDGDFVYLVRFMDAIPSGSTAPFDYITDDLKQIVLNARKQKLISELEQRIYSKGQDDENFQVYKR
ncbi:MAG: peptidyl-prolyl cis-trans isomerase [Bacteroidales bacterium]|nr:peptidyl-prolyl cis-trans isomerase [Bacteroidales bacterium]HOA08894.1 hypothetical protein [Tenuifilaceae bacterium]MBP8642729.1 peptidyl-prolyl cis-trans isomerase [Bacteroidales bacterium]NLI87835.1 peptidyl-prolyl cis-trans isomerase [Bacteroidales bacterium]HOC35694.1 hypothetical protein [Tenuifilaceae bacterium]